MYTVVFDLDDTLYDRNQPLEKAFLKFNPANGLSFDSFLKIFTKNSDLAFDQVKDGIWTLKESHIFRIRETLREMEIKISDDQAQVFQASYEDYQQTIKPYPEMVEILDYLQEKEIQTLIMTNGPSKHQRTKIKNLGLDLYFKPNEIIVSEEEGMTKPDKRIFELAEKRFHFNKNNAWFIGDSFDNDMVGAFNAGWHSIWFNKNNKLISHHTHPTKTVISPLKLKEYLLDHGKSSLG